MYFIDNIKVTLCLVMGTIKLKISNYLIIQLFYKLSNLVDNIEKLLDCFF